MNYKLLLTLMLLVPAAALAEAGETAMAQTHEEQIRDWRQTRDERLASDSGWMTLVGLEWLQEGENLIGSSAASNTIKIPGGPAHWGTIHLDGDELRFVPALDSGVTVNGAEATEVLLVADNAGEPTLISSGNLSFYVIFRESYALRIKDSQAPALQEFTGIKTYDFQPDWRFNARFIPAEEGQAIEIANVLGHFSPSPVYGFAEFQRDGVNYRLLALGDETSESLWFLFADRTSGRDTYGAGRFLYSDGMPENERLVVDFNKAYNSPCAFNDYSTCPLPPQQNRLDLAVTAGERDYHSK
jgi:uncharacterized protein (DUF1684 family)